MKKTPQNHPFSHLSILSSIPLSPVLCLSNKNSKLKFLPIYHLKENAYGVSICKKIHELTGKLYTYGTLYKILVQIIQRGYVIKVEGEPIKERRGRRKMFYKLSADGVFALKNSHSIQISLWQGIDWNHLEGEISRAV